MRYIPVSLLIAVTLTGCSRPEREQATSGFSVYEEDGVAIAETIGGPRYTEELFKYERAYALEEDPENPDSYLFRPAVIFFMDQKGYHYIADQGSRQIAIYGPDGKYIRRIGRAGDGPGEFREIWISSLHGDILNIWDRALLRSTLYRTDGTLIDVLSSPRDDYFDGMHRDPAGNSYYFYTDQRVRGNIRYHRGGVRIRDERGKALSDIRTDPTPMYFRHRETAMSIMPFIGYPTVLLLDNGEILATTGNEPNLKFYNREGDLIHEIRLDLSREPVSEREVRATRDTLRAVAQPGSQGDFQREFADAVVFPETKAFWNGVFQDTGGYFWLNYATGFFSMGAEGGEKYRILSPEGEYLGDTQCPGRYGRVCYAKYLTLETDEETGSRIPVVYRIVPAVEGLVYP